MNAIKYFTCIVLLTLTPRFYSQIPDTIWTKTFGGPLADVGNSVKQTNDGGFIVAGTTSSFGAGGQDIYLIRTDENGDTLWTKTFGGTGNDRASNVVQTNDNGYAVFGTTNSFGNGGDDFLLWKMDSLGNTEWFKTYGTSLNEVASEGQQTFDGGFVIVGDYYNQYYRTWAVKADSLGDDIWNKSIGRISSDLFANSVQQTDDDGFAICGTWRYWYSGSYRFNYTLTRLSASGDSLFIREYERVGHDVCKIVRKTFDGNLLLGGNSAYDNIWLLKVNPNGGILWSRTLPYSWTSLTHLETDFDTGYIITVVSELYDFQILKTDNDGIVEWEKLIGGSQYDYARSVYPTNDSGYIVTGETKSFGAGDNDIWLMKFNYPTPINVQINFFPPVDTALVLGGCTTPEFTCKNLVSTNYKDSISIEPGFNTYFYYFDSTGTQIPLDNYYFLVIDSLNEYDYELWYHPKSYPPFDPVLIEFDSTFFSEQNKFNIQLVVKKDGLRIDSLSQPFHADFGLSVDDSGIIPIEFSLSQNYPNPFNPTTKINFQIPDQVRNDSRLVTLIVYDVLGNEIVTLVNEEKQPGIYEVEFSAKGGSASGGNAYSLPSGIYFYQLKAGDFIETKKMVLIK